MVVINSNYIQMKKIGFVIFLALPFAALGQSAGLNTTSSAGEETASDLGTIEWTLGGIITESGSNQTHQISQGIQQGNLSVSTLTPEQATTTHVVVYPNPVAEKLTIESDQAIITYQLLDMHGNIALTGEIKNRIGTVNFSALSSGIYILITSDRHRFRVVKK